MTTPKIIPVDPGSPDPGIIHKAGEIIRNKGVVIFPAKCLYGVAADALDPSAVEKVFDLKQRPADKPLLVLIPNKRHLEKLVQSVPPEAIRLMDTFWPGSLTVILKAKPHLSSRLTAGTGKLGVRIPGHPVARALVDYLDAPITGTSANLSGKPGCSRPDMLDPALIKTCDMVLDAGLLKGGKGSTIVDATLSPPLILREGEVLAGQIEEALKT